MATKAELSAELARLRQMHAEHTATQAPKSAQAAPQEPASNPDWAGLLAEHGLDMDDPARLLQRLSKELGALKPDKTLLSVAAAFGLGFALGRMSK